MKTNALVSNLLKKAGITFEGEVGEELPDEVATQLDNSLLTVQAATNNHPQVKKVYFAQAYNGLDAEMDSIMDELGMDDATKASLKAEPSSTKRAVALVKKVKELESAKGKPDEGKVGSLQQQIVDLHNKIKDEQEARTELQKNYERQISGIRIQAHLDTLIGQYETVYDQLPVEAKTAAINALLQKSLQDNEAQFAFDEKGTFTVMKKDGTNLFGENHTQMTPQAFIDKAVSKIIKVTETPSGGVGKNQPAVTSVNGGNATNSNAALKAAVAENLTAYEQASKSAVQG